MYNTLKMKFIIIYLHYLWLHISKSGILKKYKYVTERSPKNFHSHQEHYIKSGERLKLSTKISKQAERTLTTDIHIA